MSEKTQEPKRDDLDRVNELFSFLRGYLPKDYKVDRASMTKLTAKQARTIIWYLGGLYWKVPDHIHPCCMCGDFFDKDREGDCLDYGKPPYFFCESCMSTDVYARKAMRDPNK
jgi:hypothetical protein